MEGVNGYPKEKCWNKSSCQVLDLSIELIQWMSNKAKFKRKRMKFEIIQFLVQISFHFIRHLSVTWTYYVRSLQNISFLEREKDSGWERERGRQRKYSVVIEVQNVN